MHHPLSAPLDANDSLEVGYDRQQRQRRSNLWSPNPESPVPSQRISRIPNEFSGQGYTYAVNPITPEGLPQSGEQRALRNLQEANNPPPARCTRSQTDPVHDINRD